ncbi:MAG: 50S ribosomal protein L3 [Candidatus Nanoarchaeia archaeon]|nr:50S ribosomal protein L3 [Candidatus Nanoarchaeia archaeon]MDD5239672.1 50S ribosomal protein L3 [Candidatus Nanoarchaeia archaeon]
MGHQIGKAHSPSQGSQGFSPRVRASRMFSRIKNWMNTDTARLLGFAGYKAGMAHVTYVDNHPHSPTKGEVICVPVTILEVPKTKIYSIRLYGKNDRRQKVCLFEVHTDKITKDLGNRLTMPKKKKNVEELLNKAEALLGKTEDVTVTVYTMPEGIFGKKKPDIFEIKVGGKTSKEKFDFAKSVLGKDVSAKEVLKAGELVDIIAVTKGKGFQGPVKRFGVKCQPRYKSDTTRRGVASIGPDVPRKVSFKVAMPGQMGFHNRVDYKKWILKIGDNGADVNPKAGFLSYGNVAGEYIMIHGSVPGPAKRLIRMRLTVKPHRHMPTQAPEILTVSKVNK